MIRDRAQKAIEELSRREQVGPCTATLIHSLYGTIEWLEAALRQAEAWAAVAQKTREFINERLDAVQDAEEVDEAVRMSGEDMMPCEEEAYRVGD